MEIVLKRGRDYCNGKQLPEYLQTEKYCFKDTMFFSKDTVNSLVQIIVK